MYILTHLLEVITLISLTVGFPPAGVVNLEASKKENDVISMLTFNTWLIPVRARFPDFLDPNVHKRGQKISKDVEDLVNTYDLDFVTLQEVWSPTDSAIATIINKIAGGIYFARKEVENGIRKNTHLKYATKVHGTHPFSLTTATLDSGLLVMSRWPIIMEKFEKFTDATGSDKFAAKGAIGVILNRTDDVVILVTTHLDAGTDSEVKLTQLNVVSKVVEELEEECSARGYRVAATFLTGDFNIDATGRRPEEAKDKSHERARAHLHGEGFEDIWRLYAEQKQLPDPSNYTSDWANLTDKALSDYGITYDQDIPSSPARLDYLWLKTDAADDNGAGIMAAGKGSSHEVVMFQVGPSELWRGDVELRNAYFEAKERGDKKAMKKLQKEIYAYNDARTSDHGSVVSRVRLLSPPKTLSASSRALQGKDDQQDSLKIYDSKKGFYIV